jgi:hypothetical protein
MVLLHTITFNNTASSYDITPYVTGYEIYKFYVQRLPSNGSNQSFATGPRLGFQFSTDAGATWITTGYKGRMLFDKPGGVGGYDFTTLCSIANYNLWAGVQVQSEAMLSGYGSSVCVNVHATQGGVLNQSPPSDPPFYEALVAVHSSALITASTNGIRVLSDDSTIIPGGKLSIYGIAT